MALDAGAVASCRSEGATGRSGSRPARGAEAEPRLDADARVVACARSEVAPPTAPEESVTEERISSAARPPKRTVMVLRMSSSVPESRVPRQSTKASPAEADPVEGEAVARGDDRMARLMHRDPPAERGRDLHLPAKGLLDGVGRQGTLRGPGGGAGKPQRPAMSAAERPRPARAMSVIASGVKPSFFRRPVSITRSPQPAERRAVERDLVVKAARPDHRRVDPVGAGGRAHQDHALDLPDRLHLGQEGGDDLVVIA